MGRYAVVDDATLEVDNVIEWDGITRWAPPEGFSAVALPDDSPVAIGDVKDPKVDTFDKSINTKIAIELGITKQGVVEIANAALAVNDSFLALTDPTIADVLVQVQDLTVQTSKLVRFVLAQLDPKHVGDVVTEVAVPDVAPK